MRASKVFNEHDLKTSAGVTLSVDLQPYLGIKGCSIFRATVDKLHCAAYLGPDDTVSLMESLFAYCLAERTLDSLPVAIRQAMIEGIYSSLPRGQRPASLTIEPAPKPGNGSRSTSPKMWRVLRVLRKGPASLVDMFQSNDERTLDGLVNRGYATKGAGKMEITDLGRAALDSFLCGADAHRNGWMK